MYKRQLWVLTDPLCDTGADGHPVLLLGERAHTVNRAGRIGGVWVRVCLFVCTCTWCVRVWLGNRVYRALHTHRRAHTRAHTHKHTHTHAHVRTHPLFFSTPTDSCDDQVGHWDCLHVCADPGHADFFRASPLVQDKNTYTRTPTPTPTHTHGRERERVCVCVCNSLTHSNSPPAHRF